MGSILNLSRQPQALQNETFDLLIVGAGIFGACAAWEAALRGYNVAIVEQNDFGSGVSANSYKVVHGGIRYVQHLDISRVRSSCRERSTLLRIAPHLVKPQPFVIPTYGYGMSGKPVLMAGMSLYDLLTADRNRGIDDPDRQIPMARTLGRQQVIDLFPGIEQNKLTGATQFSDAQMYNPPRLVLSFLQSAASKGATICNYTQVDSFKTKGDSVVSASVTDRASGEQFEIRAKSFLNTAGPWTDGMLDRQHELKAKSPGIYSRDACFVVRRKFDHDKAVAVMGQTHDPDALMSRPGRHLFVVPWRDYSLIGVWHKVVAADPENIGIDQSEVEAFIKEVHGGYPQLELTADDVEMCNWGLVPFGEEQSDGKNLSYGKRSILLNHAEKSGPANMISLIGIRYTMGRGDSHWAVNSIANILGDDRAPVDTTVLPIYGGEIAKFSSLVDDIRQALPEHISDKSVVSLAHNYGSNALRLVYDSNRDSLKQVGSGHVLALELENAVHNEMATNLSDIMLRRTDFASGGMPDDATVRECVTICSRLLGLKESEKTDQLTEVKSRIPGWKTS